MKAPLDPWYNTNPEEKGKLTYLSFALLGACNLDCVFCYVDGSREGGWDSAAAKKIFDEAKELGMQKIQLTGGEPLLYPSLEEVLDHLTGLDTEILLVTNGTLVTEENARLLAKHRVNVGVSFETIEEEVSDALSNQKGSHQEKLAGIAELKRAGYTSALPLNILMKTLKQNFPSYIKTWEWALKEGIQPILDRAIPTTRCKREWVVEGEELHYLLDEIGKLQGTQHRIPFLNNEGCNRMGMSAHIEANGEVYSCAGLPISMGNVLKTGLAEIWLNNDFAKACKEYHSKLSGSCGSCEEVEICGGCRAIAYQITGDPFGPDPLCWKYKKGK